ncbi:CRISPR-associated CARF protein Csa3 [Candidatus Hecatella orcuttiae]|uniref:CRISPR-associated CARF protein Csa3 n=1 Tax=Candidatus Hecatella orcuttiae TaxID=1935119 RepID=UPI0028681B2B|nr:CRISPR-associated CARF protein Csa3 [Candidatus Hecatella orcuttiae]
MSKTFINTFGFTESAVLAPVVRLGLSRDDKLVVLVPKGIGDEARVSNAMEKLREMLNAISGGTIGLERLNIPVEDFVQAVSLVKGLIEREASRGEVYLNLSGGMRALVLEAYTAALLSAINGVRLSFTDLELEGAAGTVRLTPLGLLRKLSETERMVLRTLGNSEGMMETGELLKALDVSSSTLSRVLRRLASDGFVTLRREGRKIQIQASELGKMLT